MATMQFLQSAYCQPTSTTTRAGLNFTTCANCGQEYLSFRKRVCPKAR